MTVFLWIGTEMDTGLGMGSCEQLSEHPFRKGQASVGPEFPEGRFQCFSVVTTVT